MRSAAWLLIFEAAFDGNLRCVDSADPDDVFVVAPNAALGGEATQALIGLQGPVANGVLRSSNLATVGRGLRRHASESGT